MTGLVEEGGVRRRWRPGDDIKFQAKESRRENKTNTRKTTASISLSTSVSDHWYYLRSILVHITLTPFKYQPKIKVSLLEKALRTVLEECKIVAVNITIDGALSNEAEKRRTTLFPDGSRFITA